MTEAAHPAQAQVLAELAKVAQFFHTPAGEPYAIVPVASHCETWPIRSKRFRLWLADRYFEGHGKPPGAQALSDAVTVLEARARLRAPERPVFIRVGECDGNVYLDLANDRWQVVQITACGWTVLDQSPVAFRRTNAMQALPPPIAGGTLDELRAFVNLPDHESWMLLQAWLVGALHPRGPFPLLVLQGEQGSAKSTTARLVRQLIDPSTSPLRTVPATERDLMIAAVNARVLCFDNLSGLSPGLSDAFCRLSTGGAFTTRELYSNDEETILDAQRPVILNGIDDLLVRHDFTDRAIVLTLPAIDESTRRPERELKAAFTDAHPRLLGALCDAVGAALANYASVTVPHAPRMADFAKWICAASPQLGFSQEDFLHAYAKNRREATERGLEASPIAGLLRGWIEQKRSWSGTATELLKELYRLAIDPDQRSRQWPTSAHGLKAQLQRLVPALRSLGIAITFHREPKTGRRLITIRSIVQPSVTLVTPVTRSADRSGEGDKGDAESIAQSALDQENEV